MATRFLHKGLPLEAQPYGNVAPFAVNENSLLTIRRGVPAAGHIATDVGEEVVSVNGGYHAINAAALTLVASDQYTVWDFATAVAVTVTLPAATSKARFTFVQSVAPTTTNTHIITPYTGDGIGGNAGNHTVLSFVDDKSLYVGDATGVSVTLQADGTADWYIIAATGTQTKQS